MEPPDIDDRQKEIYALLKALFTALPIGVVSLLLALWFFGQGGWLLLPGILFILLVVGSVVSIGLASILLITTKISPKVERRVNPPEKTGRFFSTRQVSLRMGTHEPRWLPPDEPEEPSPTD